MADVWKSMVLPRIQEVVKSFDESKVGLCVQEEISKESEEKKPQLQPKVTEIYEASPAQIKDHISSPVEDSMDLISSSRGGK
ncbi:hypothetical protein OPV22_030740 [Ensete ventricosum]|uniref:Uncharacterized protein n=1 Tax=Ensete ventricosum TaxID=4639 RepID=A0AAV8PUJ4_ENSVE|nr:hypothetical protein OPV22_030740 [Ensete ventricosum]